MFDPDTKARLDPYLAGRPEILAVLLFGSHARGEATPGSDVDLGVLLDRKKAREGLYRSRLTSELMEVLGTPHVDVVILDDAPPLLLHRVLRDGHLLYSVDDRAVAEFTIRAMQKYEDTKPLRELQANRLRAKLDAVRD